MSHVFFSTAVAHHFSWTWPGWVRLLRWSRSWSHAVRRMKASLDILGPSLRRDIRGWMEFIEGISYNILKEIMYIFICTNYEAKYPNVIPLIQSLSQMDCVLTIVVHQVSVTPFHYKYTILCETIQRVPLFVAKQVIKCYTAGKGS